MEQGKLFKQGKPERSTLSSSVSQWGSKEVLASCPRISSSFPGLVSEGPWGDQDVTHCRMPNTLWNSRGFPLSLGALARQRQTEPLQGMGWEWRFTPSTLLAGSRTQFWLEALMVAELELFSKHLKNYFFIINVCTFIVVNLDNADKQREENRNPW